MGFFGFDYWYERAQRGDPWATEMTWSTLKSSVEDRCLSEDQWHLVLRLISAVTDPARPNKVMNPVNHALALGRRRGRKPKYLVDAERFAFAREIFDLVGVARGEALDEGIRRVYLAVDPTSDDRDQRWARKAYLEHLPFLLELQQLHHDHHLAIGEAPLEAAPPEVAPPPGQPGIELPPDEPAEA